MTNFNKLLGGEVLSEDVQKSLQEAFDTKLTEARQQIQEETELRIREEFARRYEHDKAELVEAMDRMLGDVVQKYESERITEASKLREAKAKYKQAVKESRDGYRGKLKEHMQTMRRFVIEQMTKEVRGLREHQRQLAEAKVKAKQELRGTRKEMAEHFTERLKKIDEFAVRQVSRELREFTQDKRALVETRVRLVAEARNRLKETQKRFVKEAAKKVDYVVTESLKNEMTQLHEDLERNRQNMYGRRIFEAVAAEFMTSYFSDGTQTKKMMKMVETQKKELAAIKSQLTEAKKLADVAGRKAKLAEEVTTRTKLMNELLGPLSREKREVMGELLETVKTTHLREAFNKYLPTVLNESGRKVTAQGAKRPLNETHAPVLEKRTVAVTGDQRANRLMESVQAEGEISSETARILQLANIPR